MTTRSSSFIKSDSQYRRISRQMGRVVAVVVVGGVGRVAAKDAYNKEEKWGSRKMREECEMRG